MIITVAILIFSAVVIYLSCEYFVNGIEWFGKRFHVSQYAVGTILAAFGTALPESVVTFVAVVFGINASQKDIGVGAALGGPLVLSTIAYAIVGVGSWFFRKRRTNGRHLDMNSEKLSRDQLWFLIIFVFKVSLGFMVFTGKMWTGLLFFLAYGVYAYKEMSGGEGEYEEASLEPLKIRRNKSNPETQYILLQTVLSLVVIFVSSQIFVKQLDFLSLSLGVPPHIVALLLSPIATELPEILNAIIWIKQGKEKLALANISGAMMVQATVPSALGILFTPWLFDKSLTLAAIMTTASILFLWFTLKRKMLSARRLSFAVLFYLLFAVLLKS